MHPTLCTGDIVLVTVGAYRRRKPCVGEIIVAHHPYEERMLIKRISAIGTAGVYLQGDNPQASTDSRAFGCIPLTAIVGPVTVRIRTEHSDG